jgi:hypothetical protein
MPRLGCSAVKYAVAVAVQSTHHVEGAGPAGRSTALAIPVAAIALTVTFYVFYDGSLQTASRYGLPFLAATAIGAGVMIRRKAAPFVALFGAAMWIGVFVAVLRA